MQDKITTISEDVSSIIQRKRINLGLSFKDLEFASNQKGVKMNASTIEKIEKGIILPKSEQLYTLLLILGCTLTIDGEEIL